MISDSGARPILVRNSGGAPRICPAPNTTLDGIWIGGRGVNDSISEALGHGSSRALTSGDSIINCVVFNTWSNGMINGGGHSVVIKNTLFVNCGIASNQLSHAIYMSSPDPRNSSQAVASHRNVFITTAPADYWYYGLRSGHKWASHGYSIHYWHNPTFARISKNFTNYQGVHQGRNLVMRDNVFWQGGVQMSGLENVRPDTVTCGIDSPKVWRRNFIGKDDRSTYQQYWGWPPQDSASADGNEWRPESRWWDGDSTWMANGEWHLRPGYMVRSFGAITGPTLFSYPDSTRTLLGATAAGIDTAIDRLARSFYDRTAEDVHQDQTILENWQVLFDVVDFWQGTPEERADKNATAVEPEDVARVGRFSLSQNYPNPFNPVTRIRFEIPRMSVIDLKVYDSLGKEIKTLVEGPAAAGLHEVEFSAGGLASGVYYARLVAGEYQSTRKLMLIR
jgi:hypothetical protein